MAGVPKRTGKKRTGSKYAPKRKVCIFCADKNAQIDYKDPSKLLRYISDRGRIEPRRKTGACARHQRAVAQALKRARHLALLPYAPCHIRRTGGVGLHQERQSRSS